MKKIVFVIYCLLQFAINYAQNCPPNEELRDVKCNGKITKVCVPVSHTCGGCWIVKWPPCPGQTNGGEDWFGSYEKALNSATKESSRGQNDKSIWWDGECHWYDNRSFTIFLDDSKLCGTNKNDSSLFVLSKDDFKQKFASLIDSWKYSIAEAIARYKKYTGHSWPPELGQVTTEYAGNIQDAIKNNKKAELFNANLADKNLEEINEQFQNFDSQYKEFQNSQTTFEQENKNKKNANSWITLPDGTFYQKLPNGMISFFDGVDQIETLSAAEGKAKLAKYKLGANDSNSNRSNNSTATYSDSSYSNTNSTNTYNNSTSTNFNKNNPSYSNNSKVDTKELREAYNKLAGLIAELKKHDDGSNAGNIKILENQLETIRQELNK